jgi:tRNA-2-methylthio-N6-dimethylallyladenosine synthase|tara:strand:- start:2491 stop:3903 length:1413 start_codon:yes stop_codon:yes gene_type:complete
VAKKLFIKTYGCQMNVYDSARMADVLAPIGFTSCSEAGSADMIILNTCHIREKASEKVYSELGRLRHIKEKRLLDEENTIIAVAGCVAQAEGEEILRRAPYVDIVLGPQTYHRLPEMVARAARAGDKKNTYGRGVLDTDFPTSQKFDHLPNESSFQGVSAFLSVQEGCDKFCTFCVVPYTRGAEFSRPVEQILNEAKRLVENGAKEIILLGQNVNAYHGLDEREKETSLGRLINRLSEVDGIERVRYTTSHPNDMNKDLILAHGQQKKLMPFLHLPVQSGSNKILQSMNRRHSVESYLDIISDLRKSRPDMALSSDFIVGFPGESDEDFEETIDLIKEVKFSQAYSFKYSVRPGTPAGSMAEQVPDELKDERLFVLQDVLKKQQTEFNSSKVGKVLKVLLEKSGRHASQLIGRSQYNQAVHVNAPEYNLGSVQDVNIDSVLSHTLQGSIKKYVKDIEVGQRSEKTQGEHV